MKNFAEIKECVEVLCTQIDTLTNSTYQVIPNTQEYRNLWKCVNDFGPEKALKAFEKAVNQYYYGCPENDINVISQKMYGICLYDDVPNIDYINYAVGIAKRTYPGTHPLRIKMLKQLMIDNADKLIRDDFTKIQSVLVRGNNFESCLLEIKGIVYNRCNKGSSNGVIVPYIDSPFD